MEAEFKSVKAKLLSAFNVSEGLFISFLWFRSAVKKDAANQKDAEFQSMEAKPLSTFDVNKGLHHKCDAQSDKQQALKTEAQKYRALVGLFFN